MYILLVLIFFLGPKCNVAETAMRPKHRGRNVFGAETSVTHGVRSDYANIYLLSFYIK